MEVRLSKVSKTIGWSPKLHILCVKVFPEQSIKLSKAEFCGKTLSEYNSESYCVESRLDRLYNFQQLKCWWLIVKTDKSRKGAFKDNEAESKQNAPIKRQTEWLGKDDELIH